MSASATKHDAASTRDGHVPHPLHPDIPPVAATESGGPPTSPGTLERPHRYRFEVVPGFFMQTGPEPKHVEFEELVRPHCRRGVDADCRFL